MQETVQEKKKKKKIPEDILDCKCGPFSYSTKGFVKTSDYLRVTNNVAQVALFLSLVPRDGGLPKKICLLPMSLLK